MKETLNIIKDLLRNKPRVFAIFPEEFNEISALRQRIEEHREALNLELITFSRQNDPNLEKEKIVRLLEALDKNAIVIIPTHSLSAPMQLDPYSFKPAYFQDPWIDTIDVPNPLAMTYRSAAKFIYPIKIQRLDEETVEVQMKVGDRIVAYISEEVENHVAEHYANVQCTIAFDTAKDQFDKHLKAQDRKLDDVINQSIVFTTFLLGFVMTMFLLKRKNAPAIKREKGDLIKDKIEKDRERRNSMNAAPSPAGSRRNSVESLTASDSWETSSSRNSSTDEGLYFSNSPYASPPSTKLARKRVEGISAMPELDITAVDEKEIKRAAEKAKAEEDWRIKSEKCQENLKKLTIDELNVLAEFLENKANSALVTRYSPDQVTKFLAKFDCEMISKDNHKPISFPDGESGSMTFRSGNTKHPKRGQLHIRFYTNLNHAFTDLGITQEMVRGLLIEKNTELKQESVVHTRKRASAQA